MKRLLLLAMAFLAGIISHAQLLTWSPPFPTENNPAQVLEIVVDASRGNKGLMNHTAGDVYVHIGVITSLSNSSSDWKYVPFTWGTTAGAAQAAYLGNNKWKYTINGSLRTFFGITNAFESIRKIAILFRSGNGNKKQTNSDGSDMYIPVYNNAFLEVRLDNPPSEPRFIRTPEPQSWAVGTSFTVEGKANKVSNMKLYHNNTVLTTATGVQSITGTSTITALGSQQLVVEASDGTTTKYDTLTVFVAPPESPVAPLPAGVKDGINYEPGNTSAVLVLHAPGKKIATLIGEFTNWQENISYIMNKTPDGNKFWLRVSGLTPGMEYGFQYKVDDTIKIADPYAEKILDPFNDQFITPVTYPGLKPYPAGQSGMVSVLQTQPPAYTWAVNNFNRPDKRGLVIYELLLRDFIAAHDWKTLRDTLSYLKRLGVNAIEIMPVTEFEGNNSWGYNTFQYFAPDKYYGTKNALKEFIDSSHKNGIAVIMDIVLNHTYGPSPFAQLYWDRQNNRPAANNPWYNPVQPHAFGFGEDFNHESVQTKEFFNRVLQHWITEYKVDGYRIDFSKGLTQRASSNDASFSAYDASRIAIINGYANAIRAVDPASYIILEHFADNTEEKELSDNGMLLWANVWSQYQEAAMGYLANSNFERGIHTVRGWTNPHLVTFMESHDEERITYKNIKYGNSSGSYNVRDTATALKRMELSAAFFFTIPGPKMIWQFGELGYDYSRCYLSTNGEGGDCNKKTDPKPIRWEYAADPRRKAVYEVYSKLIHLRFHPSFKEVFVSNRIESSLNGAFKWIKLTTDTSNLLVIGNFDVTPTTGNITFQQAGTWYDYLNNTTFTATGAAQSFTLQPGEYKVFVNRNVNNLVSTPVTNLPLNSNTLAAKVFPNPASGRMVIEVDIPQSGAVSVEVISSTGQQAGLLHQAFMAKGRHNLILNRKAIRVGSGVYYLKVTTKSSYKILPITLQ